jgi:hypothetical protein
LTAEVAAAREVEQSAAALMSSQVAAKQHLEMSTVMHKLREPGQQQWQCVVVKQHTML